MAEDVDYYCLLYVTLFYFLTYQYPVNLNNPTSRAKSNTPTALRFPYLLRGIQCHKTIYHKSCTSLPNFIQLEINTSKYRKKKNKTGKSGSTNR